MRTGSQSGFTLLELIVTVTVAIVLLTMAVPNMMGALKSNRLVAESNQLVQALRLARSHAIRSGGATVCASADYLTCTIPTGGPTGYIVLDKSNKVIRAYDPPPPAVTLKSEFMGVTFGNVGNAIPILTPPSGGTTTTTTASTEFMVEVSSCTPGATVDEANIRRIIVLVSGKLINQRVSCQGVVL